MVRHRFKSIIVAAFILSMHSVVANEVDQVDEFREEPEVLPPTAVDLMLSFLPRDVDARRKFYQAHLYDQVESCQRSCNLTRIQSDKLKLAGRIEIEQYFAKIEVYRRQYATVGMTRAERVEAMRLIHQTEPRFVFQENSLCNKVAATILSTEQLRAYFESLQVSDQRR